MEGGVEEVKDAAFAAARAKSASERLPAILGPMSAWNVSETMVLPVTVRSSWEERRLAVVEVRALWVGEHARKRARSRGSITSCEYRGNHVGVGENPVNGRHLRRTGHAASKLPPWRWS